MSNLLEIKGLNIHYATREGLVKAVDGVDLTIHKGETFGLVGESGCGKSTLGKGILRVLPEEARTSGSILFGGKDLLKLNEKEMRNLRGRNLTLIFQDPMTRLDPLMTVSDHFVEAVKAHKPETSEAEALDIASKVLADVGIPPSRLHQYPHEFSGGMRQRIMIAMSLIFNPTLLVADEPTTSLDVIVEAQILKFLKRLRDRYEMSILLITHNLGLIAEVCDRLAVMYAGKIVEVGDVFRVFQEPLHPYTRALLQSVIDLETTKLNSIPGSPPNLLDPPAACRFWPRCNQVKSVCKSFEPRIKWYDDEHGVACFLYH